MATVKGVGVGVGAWVVGRDAIGEGGRLGTYDKGYWDVVSGGGRGGQRGGRE